MADRQGGASKKSLGSKMLKFVKKTAGSSSSDAYRVRDKRITASARQGDHDQHITAEGIPPSSVPAPQPGWHSVAGETSRPSRLGEGSRRRSVSTYEASPEWSFGANEDEDIPMDPAPSHSCGGMASLRRRPPSVHMADDAEEEYGPGDAYMSVRPYLKSRLLFVGTRHYSVMRGAMEVCSAVVSHLPLEGMSFFVQP